MLNFVHSHIASIILVKSGKGILNGNLAVILLGDLENAIKKIVEFA